MSRVLLAGIFHETHTFLDDPTPAADFLIRRGDELLHTEGDGSPMAGAVEVGRKHGWQFVPAVDFRAQPSGMVVDEVVESFWRDVELAARPALASGLDGIMLILHGAMTSASYPDVEGELLKRIRNLPGALHIPVCGVFDLHANFTAAMAEHADALVAYQHNPHTDAHAAAVRAAELLELLMRSKQRAITQWVRPPVMWPPTGTGTADDPMKALEQIARDWETKIPQLLAVNVVGGFSFADTPDTGVSFSAVTLREQANLAKSALRNLAEVCWSRREQGNHIDPPIEEMMPTIAAHREGPIIVVEPADNIGGGAPGDCTSVLRSFLRHRLPDAAVALSDPVAVAALRFCQPGEKRTLPLGGKGSKFDPGPITLEVEFVSRGDGVFELEDLHSHLASMYGRRIDMGPSAVVRHQGVTILLTSRKTAPFDLGQWRSQGVIPEKLRFIGVKAAVAHRRAYDKIMKKSYTVDTPGPCSSNLRNFSYRLLKRPIYPLDAEVSFDPTAVG